MMGGWPRTSDGVVPRLVVLLGPVGSGKTELGIALAQQMAPKDRLLVAGHVDKIALRLGVPFHRVPPYQRAEIQEFFARVEGSDQHLCWVLDDCDIYMSMSAYAAPALYVLINTGRNYGKGGILIGHGSNTIPKNLILNAHMVCFFRTDVPSVIDWAEDFMWRGWPFGETEREKKADLSQVLTHLPQYQFLVFTPLDANKFPGFGKVVNGRPMLFPLTDRPDGVDDESTSDAESADGSSPTDAADPGTATSVGENTSESPPDSEPPGGEPRRVSAPSSEP